MKKIITTFLAMLMVFSAIGCGASEQTGSVEQETTAEAPAKGSSSDKVWVIATDSAFKPFEYTADNGEFVGIDMDILAAVAEDQGFKYDLQILGWDARPGRQTA